MAEEKAPHVLTAILAVMKELGEEGIGKDRRNKDQGFNFRGVEDVMNALTPLLVKHSLVIIPRFKTHSSTDRLSKNGGYLNDVVVSAEFDFMSAIDGSMVTGSTYGQGMDSADKATNKAMSGAFKYLSFFGFCIPTFGVIDDTDNEHPEVRGKEKDAKTDAKTDTPAGDAGPKRNKRSPESPEPRGGNAPPADDEPPPPADLLDAPPAEGKPSARPEEQTHTQIPDGEDEQPLNWRVENVWPVLIADVREAKGELFLKLCFQRAYKWAKALPNEQVSRNLLAGVTEIYNKRKKDIGIG
jgi:hypothetical protein